MNISVLNELNWIESSQIWIRFDRITNYLNSIQIQTESFEFNSWFNSILFDSIQNLIQFDSIWNSIRFDSIWFDLEFNSIWFDLTVSLNNSASSDRRKMQRSSLEPPRRAALHLSTITGCRDNRWNVFF